MTASTSESLLLDLFAELVEPLMVISSDHDVVFRSQAMEALIGPSGRDADAGCEKLLAGTLDGLGGECCWSCLDAYVANADAGLWRLSRPDGSSVLALCEMQPISIGKRRSMLALRFRLPPDRPSPVAISFFRAMREDGASDAVYLTRASYYLKDTYGVSISVWLRGDSASHGEFAHVHGLDGADRQALEGQIARLVPMQSQDARIRVGGRELILHVLVADKGEKRWLLAVGGIAGRFDERIYDVAFAALNVACEPQAKQPTARETVLAHEAMIEVLTPAQREIVNLVAAGLSNKEIAGRRRISVNTVKNHVRQILLRTGCRNRVQLGR